MPARAQLEVFLKKPAVDKVLGIVVILPSFYVLYIFSQQLTYGHFNWFNLAIVANLVVIIFTTLFRRTAVKVSTNPLFWLITLLRTFWAFLVLDFVYTYGAPSLVPPIVYNSLLVFSMVIIVYSRLSLGLNIGFLPAKRKLVTTGAYGLARHPIHTGEFVYFISYMLASFTLLNCALMILGILFILFKSLSEERFFKGDEEYREYKKEVPWLWIPYII